MGYDWIKKLDIDEFYTPIEINLDNEYYSDLKSKYTNILNKIKSDDKSNPLIKEIEKITDNILKVIQHYYSGDLKEAINAIGETINDLEDDEYIVNNVKKNMAFREYTNFENCDDDDVKQYLESDVNFFKARLRDDEKNFEFADMIHIPFNNRGKVSTQRFSIPGLPSIYLGRSAYICWIELGKPADNNFNVSHVKLDDGIKLFSIATNIEKINRYLSGIEAIKRYSIDFEKLIKTHLKVWMLSIATSYNIKEKNRNFRSEYIISQLMMLDLKNRNIDGIAYYSKRIPEYSRAMEDLGVNVVLFSKYEKQIEEKKELNVKINDNIYSKICKKIHITNSINFGEFKQLDDTINYVKPEKSFFGLNFDIDDQKNIFIAGGNLKYGHSRFRRLEKHIITVNAQPVNEINNLGANLGQKN